MKLVSHLPILKNLTSFPLSVEFPFRNERRFSKTRPGFNVFSKRRNYRFSSCLNGWEGTAGVKHDRLITDISRCPFLGNITFPYHIKQDFGKEGLGRVETLSHLAATKFVEITIHRVMIGLRDARWVMPAMFDHRSWSYLWNSYSNNINFRMR